MKTSVKAFTLSGIEVRLDASWVIVFALVTWSLAGYYLPTKFAGWPAWLNWGLGILISLLFFTSVLAHEFGHSLVAQRLGLPIQRITLFIFGGLAQLSREPGRPRDEFLIASAGPLVSLVLAGLFGLVWLGATAVRAVTFVALGGWLASVNLGLALFNLIPGFPLDGGRVLRAVVWSLSGDLRQATRIASFAGQVVAYGLIAWGLNLGLLGDWGDGLWILFIGWFLLNAATAAVGADSVARNGIGLNVRHLLEGHRASEVLMTDCPRLLPQLSLDLVAEQVVSSSDRSCFPVMRRGEFLGLLTLTRIRSVPWRRWPETRVRDVMLKREDMAVARPDDDLADVLARMVGVGIHQMPVFATDGTFVGLVAREGILRFLRRQMVRV